MSARRSDDGAAGVELVVWCRGDRHIDDHHTAEDVAITIGQCLHEALGGKIDALEELPPASNVTSLLGALLKVLGTGDLALTLCSPEPPVLTQLRDWLVSDLPMEEAVRGLPEEQGRILGTASLDGWWDTEDPRRAEL